MVEFMHLDVFKLGGVIIGPCTAFQCSGLSIRRENKYFIDVLTV